MLKSHLSGQPCFFWFLFLPVNHAKLSSNNTISVTSNGLLYRIRKVCFLVRLRLPFAYRGPIVYCFIFNSMVLLQKKGLLSSITQISFLWLFQRDGHWTECCVRRCFHNNITLNNKWCSVRKSCMFNIKNSESSLKIKWKCTGCWETVLI